jgi:hypothetical protein
MFMNTSIVTLEQLKKFCGRLKSSRESGLFEFWLRFGSVAGLRRHAPSPKPRQNSKILASNSHRISLIALGVAASVLQPLAGVAADAGARPVKDLSQASSEIHWPMGFDPETADAFVHNEIFIKAPASVIWLNLVNAAEWPKWYSNSSDMQIAGGAKTELEADVEFTWKTFGFPIKSTVHEFIANQRLGWFGGGTGIHAYHTWLIVPKDDGCEVITEESQIGPSAIQYNIEQPSAMYDGHHWWLTALKYRSESQSSH